MIPIVHLVGEAGEVCLRCGKAIGQPVCGCCTWRAGFVRQRAFDDGRVVWTWRADDADVSRCELPCQSVGHMLCSAEEGEHALFHIRHGLQSPRTTPLRADGAALCGASVVWDALADLPDAIRRKAVRICPVCLQAYEAAEAACPAT